jgi:hypothetical protein
VADGRLGLGAQPVGDGDDERAEQVLESMPIVHQAFR